MGREVNDIRHTKRTLSVESFKRKPKKPNKKNSSTQSNGNHPKALIRQFLATVVIPAIDDPDPMAPEKTKGSKIAEECFKTFVMLACNPNIPLFNVRDIGKILTYKKKRNLDYSIYKSTYHAQRIFELINSQLQNDPYNYMKLVAETVPIFLENPENIRHPQSTEAYLILQLLKGQIEGEGTFVEDTLFADFINLARIVIRRYLLNSEGEENKTYDVFQDQEIVEELIGCAKSYVEKLRAFTSAIQVIPKPIRANCNAVLSEIDSQRFKDHQPSQEEAYNNPKTSRFKFSEEIGKIQDKTVNRIPRAALGMLLEYLNLRLMGLYIMKFRDKMDDDISFIFNDMEVKKDLLAVLPLLSEDGDLYNKLSRLSNKKELIKYLKNHSNLCQKIYNEFKNLANENHEIYNNAFFQCVYLIVHPEKNSALMQNITSAINATYLDSVTWCAERMKRAQECIDYSDMDTRSELRKLSFKIFQGAFEDFLPEYRRLLVALSYKNIKDLAKEVEEDESKKLKRKSTEEINLQDELDQKWGRHSTEIDQTSVSSFNRELKRIRKDYKSLIKNTRAEFATFFKSGDLTIVEPVFFRLPNKPQMYTNLIGILKSQSFGADSRKVIKALYENDIMLFIKFYIDVTKDFLNFNTRNMLNKSEFVKKLFIPFYQFSLEALDYELEQDELFNPAQQLREQLCHIMRDTPIVIEALRGPLLETFDFKAYEPTMEKMEFDDDLVEAKETKSSCFCF